MNSVKPEAPKRETPEDKYDATVLDFFEKEIAAVSGLPEGDAEVKNVDALVLNLLQEAIADSNREEGSRATTSENFDLLSLGMNSKANEAPPSEPGQTSPESSLPKDQVQKNPPSGVRPVAALEATTAVLGIKTPELPNEVQTVIPDAAGRNGLPSPPSYQTATEIKEARRQSTPLFTLYNPGTASQGEPALSLPKPHPQRGRSVLILGGVSLCFMAAIGFGILYYRGPKGSGSNRSEMRSVPTSPTATNVTSQIEPSASSPNSKLGASNPAGPVAGQLAIDAEPELGKHPQKPVKETLPAPKPTASSQNSSDAKSGALKPAVAPALAVSSQRGIVGASDSRSGITDQGPVKADKPASNIAAIPAPTPGPSAGVIVQVAAPDVTPAPTAPADAGRTIENRATSAIKTPAPLSETPAQPALETASKTPPSSMIASTESATPGSKAVSSSPMPTNPTAAVLISKVLPVFPKIALMTKTYGTVVVDIQIDERGRVVKAIPVNGPPALRSAVVDAVLQWKYTPASVRGAGVSSQARVSFTFKQQ
jgi:TonB family protein